MPSINEAFPSAFLKADDLQGRQHTLTIQSAKVEEIGQGAQKDTKIVVSFVGKQKKFVCNKTNARTIAKLHGDDYEEWAGKQIVIAPREVEFQGSMVWAIRVSLQKPGASPIGQPVPAIPKTRTQPQTEQEAANLAADAADQDVPF